MPYRCERCGHTHETDDPPCEACGYQYLEPESEVVESTGSHVWVCTECGRTHMKNSPPCSRCGNHLFEKRDQDLDGSETTAPTYLDLASPAYLAAASVAVVALGAFVLILLGVVPLPAFLGGQPTVSDVPGNATTANDIDLGDVEAAFLADLNDRRANASNATALSSDETLTEMATYYTQRRVKAAYGDAQPPQARGLADRFDYRCEGGVGFGSLPTEEGRTFDVADYDDADTLGQALAAMFAETAVVTGDHESVGVDVHVAPDGAVYATVVVC
jgi:ribosomal protein L37E